MAVPTSFSDLSTTPGSNSPAGSDAVFPDLDNYIRFINAALASIRANAGNGWISPYAALTGATFTGAVTATTFTVNGATVPANGVYLSAANTLAMASNTTLRWSVNSAGDHTINAPSSGTALTVTAASGAEAIKLYGSANLLRLIHDSGYVAFWNSAEDTRSGYLRMQASAAANLLVEVNQALNIGTNNTTRIVVGAAGNVTINAPSSGYALNLPTKTPASAADTGTAGDVSWDTSYIYVCTAANTWKRAALATW